MKPINFPESNVYIKPSEPGDYSGIDIFSDNDQNISRWKLTPWERLKVLFVGRIWLSVKSGESMPPVFLSCKKRYFKTAAEQAGQE